MDKMQTTLLTASCSAGVSLQQDEIVAKRLDQLEDLGKYSVIYEIARIETILGHTFTQPVPALRPGVWF